jgi:glycosyltransferase involved in cell wall biosynthesis
MKISVCMASYNGEKYIAKQLTSILNQLGEEDELIISDDSSTDKTISIIKNFQDDRVRIFQKNSFFNPTYNFENAISQAIGDVIVLSDQDDVWLDDKLQIIRNNFIKKHSKPYAIVLDGDIIDDSGNIIGDSIFKLLSSGPGILKNILHNTYMGCCMAFSQELTKVILPFPQNIPMHDSWIGLLSELFGAVDFIPEKSIHYRKHGLNKSLQNFNLTQKLAWRYSLITNILKRWLLLNMKNLRKTIKSSIKSKMV